MTTAVLLDHVSAYAAAVRSHLSDLSPEQVEDLTDGLEADLAEALEDPSGPVATGENPIGRAAGSACVPASSGGASTIVPPGGASMIDLTRRFGPAAAYAAELRAAAGVEPAGPTAPGRPRRRLRGGLTRRISAARTRVNELATPAQQALAPVLATPLGRWAVTSLVALRPLWWVVRGWVWFVLGVSTLWTGFAQVHPLGMYVPMYVGAWFLLAVLVVLSIATGRGFGGRRRWARRGFVALNVVAVLALPATLSNFDNELRRELLSAYTESVEVPVYEPMPVEDGVYVDGMLVSNLFVYDEDGNPLDRVQVFDDRGRPVRTTSDGGYGSWELPGVAEPWSFAPAQDGDGRNRWNVYPLVGAPLSAWIETGSERVLVEGGHLRTPPLPFAKAPALVDRPGVDTGDAAPADERVTG